MSVRGFLFGSKVRTGLVASLFVALLVGSAVLAGAVGAPRVVAVENRFGDVNETATEVETDLVVRNGNPVGIDLGGLDVNYTVEMNDLPMANGVKRGVNLGTGNTTIDLRTRLHNDRIPDWWVSHLRRGERTSVAIEATARPGIVGRGVTFTHTPEPVETDIIGQFNSSERRAINSGYEALDPIAYVTRTNATWGEVTDEETPIRAQFTLHNPNSVPLAVTQLSYNATMNGVAVGAGQTERAYTVPPKSTKVVEATVVIDNDKLDEWWVTHVERNQRTRLVVDFAARIDASEFAFVSEPIDVPLRGVSYEKNITTDIFGTKNQTDARDSANESRTTADPTTGDTAASADEGRSSGSTTEDDGLLGVAHRRPDRLAPTG